jgi:hypothetical protein
MQSAGGEATMTDLQSYDGDLKMFRESPRSVDLARLRFLRWLAERGHLEHPAAGPPSGELAAGHGAQQRLAEAA